MTTSPRPSTACVESLDTFSSLRYNQPMHYFAYGSNMNLPHFQGYAASLGLDPDEISRPRRAVLPGHRLRTNYVSTTHQSGACTIEPDPGCMVEGLVMRITPAIRNVLREKEGWPYRYHEITVEVLAGERREPIRALTYTVAPEHCLDVDMPVTSRYRRLVLEGAEAVCLSEDYQDQLCGLLLTTDAPCDFVRQAAP